MSRDDPAQAWREFTSALRAMFLSRGFFIYIAVIYVTVAVASVIYFGVVGDVWSALGILPIVAAAIWAGRIWWRLILAEEEAASSGEAERL